MSIDPQPFRIDNEPYHLPSVADYYEDEESVTRERSVVLRELGMKAARAFPLRAGCSGRLVPPSFRRTDGCPAEDISVYAFDKVRPAPEPDRWLLRLISVYYTPRNVAGTTFEMTIAAGDGGFVVERMVALVAFD